jgi:hypothetical protein
MSACIYPRKTSLHEGGFGAPSGLNTAILDANMSSSRNTMDRSRSLAIAVSSIELDRMAATNIYRMLLGAEGGGMNIAR